METQLLVDTYFTEFLKFLKYERRYSKATLYSYEKNLLPFINFLINNKLFSLEQITNEHISQYISLIYDNSRITRRTVACKIYILKSFLKFLAKKYDSKFMKFVSDIQSVRFNKHKITPPDVEIIQKVLEAPCMTFKETRDRAILSLIYSSALRVSEVVNLTHDDIDLFEKKVKICNGKGEKDRIVPLTELAVFHIKSYFIYKLEYSAKITTNVAFLNSRYSKMTTRAVENIFTEFKKKFNIRTEFTPHSIRHAVAVNLLSQGADILVVKKILGHKSIEATENYLNLDFQLIKAKYKKAMREN